MTSIDATARYALAIDIGGTFTDVVLRRADGRVWVDKILTTYHDLLEGFFAGVDAVLARAGARPEEVTDVVAHATTVVTNALIERRGAKTALITTTGFADVLLLRNEHRYDMYDPQIEYAAPLVPRALTFGLEERVRGDGTLRKPIDGSALASLAARLRELEVVSVAVCLLNSFRNPDNEQTVGAELRRLLPGVYVSLSCEVAPQIREYPRTSTTVINAYAAPIAEPYLRRMQQALAARGFTPEPVVMLSNGGVVSARMASRFSVRMIESGPAAGALAATYYADVLGLERLLSFDMGGTTAKACLIEDGKPLVTGFFEVDRMYRFKAGSGMPVTIPSIDMIEIGAGGGSIAACGDMQLLKVGPHSAGSTPGPVCYGRGGEQFCVTDADLALGLLDADRFLGGDMRLDAAAMRERLASLATALAVSPVAAAAGVYRVVGETMASAARAHASDRGVDYRGMPMLAFGGAGPLHACYVADLVGSRSVIFPPHASVLSAFGMLVTPIRYDIVRSALATLAAFDWAAADRAFDEMLVLGRSALTEAGCRPDQIQIRFSGDLRYAGQYNEETVDFDEVMRGARDIAALRETFERLYQVKYGLRLSDNEVEVVNWRLACVGPDIRRGATVRLAVTPGRPRGEREVHFSGRTERSTRFAVWDRATLAAGQAISGPALIEERETTTVILPDWRAVMHSSGCIIAERNSAAEQPTQ